jgi:hypothetical protein
MRRWPPAWASPRRPPSSALRKALALAVLLSFFVASAPASAGGAPTNGSAAQAADPLAAVTQLLATRTKAVQTGDRGGFLATVDPKAPAAFKTAQGRSFDGLRTIPLARYQLEARTEATGDLAGGISARYGGASAFIPETRQIYRIEGYDERDVVDNQWLTYVQRDGRWYVGGDSDLEDIGLYSQRNLWDFGPVEVQRAAHVIIMSHPEQAERAAALVGIAEEASNAIAGAWDQPWSGRIPMVLPGSIDELEKILQSTFDLTKFVAFVVYQPLRDDGFVTTAPRLYVQDRNLSRYGHDFQLSTLVHELDHAAVAPFAGPAIPAWVHEGVADWVATGRSTGERKPSGSDGVVPRDYEFVTGSSASIVRSYAESRSAISYMASRYGVAAPSRFIRTLGERGPVAGSVDYNVDAVLRQLFGIGLDAFQRGWKSR